MYFMFSKFSRRRCSLQDNFGQATDGNILRHMHFTCCIVKATGTHTEYVIFIAFLRQQWLRERVSLLHYTYISCYFVIWHHYRVYPGGKGGRGVMLTTPPSSAEVTKELSCTSTHPMCPSGPVTGFPFTIKCITFLLTFTTTALCLYSVYGHLLFPEDACSKFLRNCCFLVNYTASLFIILIFAQHLQ